MKRLKRLVRWIQVSRIVRLALLVLVILASLIGLIWGTNIAQSRAILVEGNSILTDEAVVQVAEEALDAPLLGPFFKGNIIAFPKNRIESALRITLPRVATVTARRSITKKYVTLTLTERETDAIYCVARQEDVSSLAGQVRQELPESDEGPNDAVAPADESSLTLGSFPPVNVEACFLMDAGGVVFAQAPETEGSLILTLINTEGREIFLGDVAIDPEIMSGIREVWDAFKNEISVRGRRVLMRPEGIITIETFEGWEALFSVEYPLRDQLVALRELLAQELDPAARSQIDVIDLRIPGRIYYR